MPTIQSEPPIANLDEFDEKKQSVTQLATMDDGNIETESQVVYLNISEKERKKILLKVDLHMIPALALIYLFSYIDRANIGNAKIEGLEKDLGLSSSQYNVVLSMFFLTYVIFEIPSSYVLESWFRTRPSRWISIIVVVWGAMMTLHGIVQNYGGILTVRLLMGMAEAGAFPASIALLSKWYTQYELAYRLSFFYLGSALSGAFSGILAYALAKLNGVGGLEGWRWIFLIEGAATVLLGLVVPFILSDLPENKPSWLTKEEAHYLTQRMIIQNGGEEANKRGHHLSFSTLWSVISDWQMYPLIFSQWSNTVPTYGLKFTLPTIIRNMGFTASNAQLLSIPPYVAGAISALTFNYFSDKFRRRAIFLLIPQSILIVAYILLTILAPNIKRNIGPCFFAIILANIGCYPINPATSSWCSNNTSGVAKRSIAIAYMISLSSVGGIFSSYIFIQSEAPGYPTGFGVSLAFAAAGAIAVIFLDFNYSRINKKRDRMTEDEIRTKYTQAQLDALGDRSPYFRYTL